jgi:hypothetical protein
MPLALASGGSAYHSAGDPPPGAGTAEGGLWGFCLPSDARPLVGRVDDSACVCARGGWGSGGGGLLAMPTYTDGRRHLWNGWQAEKKASDAVVTYLCKHSAFPATSDCHGSERRSELRPLVWLQRLRHLLRTRRSCNVTQRHQLLALTAKHDGRDVLEVPGDSIREHAGTNITGHLLPKGPLCRLLVPLIRPDAFSHPAQPVDEKGLSARCSGFWGGSSPDMPSGLSFALCGPHS